MTAEGRPGALLPALGCLQRLRLEGTVAPQMSHCPTIDRPRNVVPDVARLSTVCNIFRMKNAISFVSSWQGCDDRVDLAPGAQLSSTPRVNRSNCRQGMLRDNAPDGRRPARS